MKNLRVHADEHPVEALQRLFSWLNEEPEQVNQRLRLLLRLWRQHPQLSRAWAQHYCQWLQRLRLYPLWVSTGIFARHTFRRELGKRIYERFNPAHKDLNDLRDVFLLLFGQKENIEFLKYVSIKEVMPLMDLFMLYLSDEQRQSFIHYFCEEGWYAIEMLAIWIAAEELEPEFIRLDKKLLDADSPLVALQREVYDWLQAQRKKEKHDDRHLQVMLIQCQEQLERLRKYAITEGSSLEVSHALERLQQNIQRLQRLLKLFDWQHLSRLRFLHFFADLIQQTPSQHEIIPLWKKNIKMLARSISQNKSDHGEHYITKTRQEYWRMFYSAAGAGIIIAFMALFKIYLLRYINSVFLFHFLSALNYAGGFMLIHVLGGTVATKQPAMTAASFAQAVERNEKGGAVRRKLALLLIDVFRSQSIAVLGNMSLAISSAMLIAWGVQHLTGEALLPPEAADYQMQALHPLNLSLWYAAIAGLWLFCSGMISGFYDNRCQYLNLRLRLREHPLLKRFLNPKQRERVADYWHEHYGSLMGNFAFGMLLGMTAFVGEITGLPLDICHVAFSSANLGYATVSADYSLFLFIKILIFVLMIGLVNLWVSFWIALSVALRARETRIDSWLAIFKDVREALRDNPKRLFLPPES